MEIRRRIGELRNPIRIDIAEADAPEAGVGRAGVGGDGAGAEQREVVENGVCGEEADIAADLDLAKAGALISPNTWRRSTPGVPSATEAPELLPLSRPTRILLPPA
jgi:hypothetical protein